MTTLDARLTDARGTVLDVGKPVAFNLSGTVAKGVIDRIAPSTRYGKTTNWHGEPHVTIHVKLSHTAAGFPAGHISKVRDPKNLLVLLDGET